GHRGRAAAGQEGRRVPARYHAGVAEPAAETTQRLRCDHPAAGPPDRFSGSRRSHATVGRPLTGPCLRQRENPGILVVMTVGLGMPALPPHVLAPRRPTRKIRVGKVEVGGDAPISVQSMTTTPTAD